MDQMDLSQMRLMLRELQYYHGKICKEKEQLIPLAISINQLTVYLNHVEWSGYVQLTCSRRTHLEYQLDQLWTT